MIKEYEETIKKFLAWIFLDGSNLQRYLNVMAKFPRFSVDNQILLMGTKPDAEMLVFYDTVMKDGHSVVVDEPVLIPYIYEEDGEKKLDYLLDIKETDYISEAAAYEPMQVLEALIELRPCPISIVPDIKKNVTALYNPRDNEILVKQGTDTAPDEFIVTLAMEMTHARYADGNEDYARNRNNLSALCVAYAVSKNYLPDTDLVEIGTLPEIYFNLPYHRAREMLMDINKMYLILYDGIEDKLKEMKKNEG